MNSMSRIRLILITAAALLASQIATAQVPFERILSAADEPENWLTYNGGYSSQRYSLLDQVTP